MSPGATPVFDLVRFEKLCSMLASPNDGERATAALKASEMLQRHGLTWSEVLASATALTRFGEDADYGRPGDLGFGAPVSAARGSGFRNSTTRFSDILNRHRQRERERDPKGQDRFRYYGGINASELVSAVHSLNPPLGFWESGFIDNLMTQSIRAGRTGFSPTRNQWERLIEISLRVGVLEPLPGGENYILTTRGRPRWTRR